MKAGYVTALVFFVVVFSVYVVFSLVETSNFNFERQHISSFDESVDFSEKEMEEGDGYEKKEKGPETEEEDLDIFIPIRIKIPEEVRAVYMTSCYAGTPSLREGLVRLIEETELNSIVIDIKDYTGLISFKSNQSDLAEAYATHCPVWNMKEVIHDINSRGIYVIGRITVFQDNYLPKIRPDLAVLKKSDGMVWRDYKGISFTDPSAKEVWDYHVRLSKEAYEIGFDELNFDYIRFPSDGPMGDTHYPHSLDGNKADIMENFFAYLYQELKHIGVVTSADLFGLTTTTKDDLGIGQIWEKALPYFDYISPMVYPSHYNFGFKGLGNPNHHPYEVVNLSLKDAVERTVATTTAVKTIGAERLGTSTPPIYTKYSYTAKKIRPWLQDFRYGGPYTAQDVRLQIQATYDAGINSWMLWDPANRYTPSALEPSL